MMQRQEAEFKAQQERELRLTKERNWRIKADREAQVQCWRLVLRSTRCVPPTETHAAQGVRSLVRSTESTNINCTTFLEREGLGGGLEIC